ncbi:mediator of RNA polymerase II transcription subunit 13 [Apophysomyces sp. BC1034]|nr:mediator of RNA polymerase II transcription subunit 13 [Apophysomyces sp. BC1034]
MPTRNVTAQQMEDHVLRQWSLLFHIPTSLLMQSHTSRLPTLISIRTASGDVILYPSALVFVPTSAKCAPSTIAGMNGILGYNRGTNDDLGEKWYRWTWATNASDRSDYGSKSVHDINYWNYTSPRNNAFWNALDSLSVNDALNTQGILQKVMSEPVLASPLMASKTIGTPTSRSDLVSDTDNSKNSDIGRFTFMSGVSLADFTLPFASDPKHMSPLYATPATDTPSEEVIRLGSVGAIDEGGQNLTDMMTKNLTIQGHQDPAATTQPPHQQYGQPAEDTTMYQSPQMQLEGDEFGLTLGMTGGENMDTMMRDIPGQWDDDLRDLDNFDLNVTEEDFDFFTEPSNSKQGTFNKQSHAAVFGETQMVVGEEPMLLAMSDLTAPSENGQLDLDHLLKEAGGLIEEPMLMEVWPKEDRNLSPNEDRASVHGTNIRPPPTQSDVENSEHIPKTEEQGTTLTGSKSDHTEISEVVYDLEHCTVPPEFAPVRFRTNVDDTKYYDGGKFTYSSPSDKKRMLKRDIYRPDYMPTRKKKPQKGDNSDVSERTPNEITVAATNDETDSSSNGDSSSETDSDSGESSVDADNVRIDQWNNSMRSAQNMFATRLFGDSKQVGPETYVVDQQVLDYDTPFSETIMPHLINPKPLVEKDYKSLDYLCQQVVMGGYPFSGGLVAAASSGEITEGESAAVVVTRRRELMHGVYGGVGHVPSLPSDRSQLIQEFKSVLSSIFDQSETLKVDPMDILCLEQPSMPPSTRVKGPLNVQQYYDLSETNQAQLKYGKYQVKKRRPAEPNLEILLPPDIVVCRQDDIIEGSPQMITFWEKLRLEPYSPKKNVRYFALCPQNEEVEGATADFLKNLSTVYEICLLGTHQPSNNGPFTRGVVPVQLLPESHGESWSERQMKSYMATCRDLGTKLKSCMTDDVIPVIYIINPGSALSSHLDLSACFQALMTAYLSSVSAVDKRKARPVMQLVPVEHILRPTAFAGYTKFGLKAIAFSLYSKCHTAVGRSPQHVNTRASEAYTPPFVLAKTVPDTITLSLKPPFGNIPAMLDQHRAIHMAYCFSLDRKWMIVVWTDNEGELVEFAVINNVKTISKGSMVSVFDEAWSRTKELARRTGLSWTYVIAKLGLMFGKELKAWTCVLPKDENIAIVNVDMESILQVDVSLNQDVDTTQAEPPQNIMHDAELLESGMTQMLLLNHRIAYTRKREQTSLGITLINPVTESEDWMLPLASGYLIHSQSKKESSCTEQFDCDPLIVEVHLVCNQTNDSAYRCLRNIIKRYHALSYVNLMPSPSNCLPIHIILVERLCRILLVVT